MRTIKDVLRLSAAIFILALGLPAVCGEHISISGDASYDFSMVVRETADGGALVAGVTDNHGAGDFDILLARYDGSGALQWAQTAGGSDEEMPSALELTSDGGFIVAGYTYSFGVGNGYRDALLLKYDATGDLQWARTAGSIYWDDAYDVKETSDYGFIVCGETGLGAPNYDHDLLLLKYDSAGTLEWARRTGGDGNDEGNAVDITSDGDYVVTGFSQSFSTGSDFDMLMVEFSDSGTIHWARTAGSTSWDWGNAIEATSDTGSVVAGYSSGFGVGGSALLMKWDGSGGLQWTRAVGGSGLEEAFAVTTTSGGGYAVAGETASFGTGSPGPYDLFLFQCGGNGTLQWASSAGGAGDDRGFSIDEASGGGFVTTGFTLDSFNANLYDIFLVRTNPSGLIPDCPHVAACAPDADIIYPTVSAQALSPVTISLTTTSPVVVTGSVSTANEQLCIDSSTIAAAMTCIPPWGVVPFAEQITVTLTNRYDGFSRRVAAHIDVALADSHAYSNWKSGWVTIGAGGIYTAGINTTIPAIQKVIGNNFFTFIAEDVTPAPYNQAPHPPSGDTATDACTVFGVWPG